MPHFEAALEIEPANEDGWKRLVDAYLATGNKAAADAARKRHPAPQR